MAKNVKNIGIDLGNSTICVAGIGSDGNRSQADLEAKIVKISPVDDKLIGYYLEITFNNIEDYIYPDEVITIKGRITNRNNLSYTQSDDYSYNINSSNYPINEKVTLYIAGKLNWGKEPNDL